MDIDNFKVKIAQRNHNPECAPKTSLFRNFQLTDAVPDAPKSIVVGESGKVHFPPSYSMANDNYRGKARVARNEYGKEYVERGKKSLPHPSHPEPPEWKGSKRISLSDSLRRSEESGALMIGWTSRRKCVNEEGMPCSRVLALESEKANYDMEGYMNRKQRVPDKQTMRNGIPERTPCDNRFKAADREPGFYAAGGIIPGSSIQLRESAKPKFVKKSEEGEGMTSKNKKKDNNTLSMTYAEKMKKKEHEYDLLQIHCLTKPTVVMGQTINSWEERTGLYLVRPEDEAY